MASSPLRHSQISEWLRFGRRVERVDATDSAIELRHRLSERSYDLAVIIIDKGKQQLPLCLRRYPSMRVLVLTEARKSGALAKWLQQGATDVASLQTLPAAHHAISRLVNECSLNRQVLALLDQSTQQRLIVKALLARHPEDFALWQNGELQQLNNQIADATGLMINANGVINEQPKLDWVSMSAKYPIGKLRTNEPGEQLMGDNTPLHDQQLHNQQLHLQRIRHHGKVARLMQVNTRPALVKNLPEQNVPEQNTDSVTGLLARDSMLQGFQRLLQSGRHSKRYTALLVQLVTAEESARTAVVNRTLQDLTIYRAADTLQRNFVGNTLVGRVSHNALLLIRPSTAVDASRLAANRVRDVLGSLGGLLDAPNEIRINTLNLAATAMSASEVVARLERRLCD